jgi:hypothetical protein
MEPVTRERDVLPRRVPQHRRAQDRGGHDSLQQENALFWKNEQHEQRDVDLFFSMLLYDIHFPIDVDMRVSPWRLPLVDAAKDDMNFIVTSNMEAVIRSPSTARSRTRSRASAKGT